MAAASRVSDHDVCHVSSAVFGKHGEQVNIDWKALRFVGDELIWEVRHILSDFYGEGEENSVFELHKIIKNNFSVVKAVLTNLGFEFWRVFTPSRKALAGNNAYYVQNGVKDELMTDEYTCTTLGVIVWLAVWSRSRQKQTDRERARGMLEAFFGAALCVPEFLHRRLCIRHDNVFNDCVERNAQEAPCKHVRYLMRDVADSIEAWKWDAFVEFFIDVLLDESCDAVTGLGNSLVREVAFYIHAKVKTMDSSDHLRNMRGFSARTKRRRVDADFRTALASLAVSSDLRPNDAARFSQLCSTTTATDALLENIKAQRFASKELMTCMGVVLLADDGSGHGKPKENTIMSLVFDAEAGQQSMVSNPYNRPTTLPPCPRFAHAWCAEFWRVTDNDHTG